MAVDKSAVADPGEGPGGPAPPPSPLPPPPLLFLGQTEARSAEKKIWGDRPPISRSGTGIGLNSLWKA